MCGILVLEDMLWCVKPSSLCSCQFKYLWMLSYVSTSAHVNMSLYLWHVGVGGIEAEAVMLGQSISMVLPKVVGYKITGSLPSLVTSTDVVLTITKVCTSTTWLMLLLHSKTDW